MLGIELEVVCVWSHGRMVTSKMDEHNLSTVYSNIQYVDSFRENVCFCLVSIYHFSKSESSERTDGNNQ